MRTETKRGLGPAIYAVDPWTPGGAHQLLSDNDRTELAKIASIVRFKKGETIYSEGDRVGEVFNIISGVVTAYRKLARGKHVISFLYPGDLFGLSKQGRYTNSTKAATPVVAYRMPLPSVRHALDVRSKLDVDIIIKLSEELRAAQRHAMLLSQRGTVNRLATFLVLQERLQNPLHAPQGEIYLPMARSSIAAYLGLTSSSLSRAFRALERNHTIASRDRRHVKVLNRVALNKLVDSSEIEVPAKSSQNG